jgi:hypothetical protein
MPDEALRWAAKATTEKERQSLMQLARIQVRLRGRQLASALGKTANCQTLVSLTLARGEVPVMLALRVSSRELDEQAPVEVDGEIGMLPTTSIQSVELIVNELTNAACDCGRCALWLCAGGCGLMG